MKARKILACLLAVAVLSATLMGSALAVEYTDVSGHWAQAAIEKWSRFGIIQGSDGLFRPNDSVTRGDLAVILNRYLGYTELPEENPFQDVPEDAYYAEAILALYQAGIFLGDGEIARPTDTITREEAAVLYARAFELDTDTDAGLSYSDSGQIASWAVDAVAAMSQAGYLQGSDGYFSPKDPLTRAQAVTILDNFGKIRIYSRFLDVLPDVDVCPYSNDLFYTENGFTYYNDDSYDTQVGIDVSYWNGDIDWNQVAAAGVDFAMIRLGNRYSTDGSIALDSQFIANIEGAQAAGIDVGVYFFSQALNEAEALEEAAFVLEALEGYELQYPVVFDWEQITGEDSRTDTFSTDALNESALAFCGAIEAAGYTPMIYANQYSCYYYYDLSQIDAYDLWYAGYFSDNTPHFYYDFEMWQYTSSGTIAGISGNVDFNLSFVNYAAA